VTETASELKDLVKKWLEEEGMFKGEVDNEKIEWHYLAECPPGSQQITDIMKPPEKDYIFVVSGIELSDEHYSALLYGCGETIEEVLENLEPVFETLVEEYLKESDEILSEKARELKRKLQEYMEAS